MIECSIGKMKSDAQILSKALTLAIKWHSGAVDKGGNPYIFHPISVALQVDTIQEKTVALLHDIIEDTPMTLSDLEREGFSFEVLQAIDAITRRDGEDRFDYLQRVKGNKLARTVKLADLINNSDLGRIPLPTEKDFARVKKYDREIKFLMD